MEQLRQSCWMDEQFDPTTCANDALWSEANVVIFSSTPGWINMTDCNIFNNDLEIMIESTGKNATLTRCSFYNNQVRAGLIREHSVLRLILPETQARVPLPCTLSHAQGIALLTKYSESFLVDIPY